MHCTMWNETLEHESENLEYGPDNKGSQRINSLWLKEPLQSTVWNYSGTPGIGIGVQGLKYKRNIFLTQIEAISTEI